MQRADNDVLLNSADTSELCGGVSAMTLWRWQKDLGFPKGVILGGHRLRWRSDVLRWIESRAEEAA